MQLFFLSVRKSISRVMMHPIILLLVALCAVPASASPVLPQPVRVSIPAAPAPWKAIQTPAPSVSSLSLRLALRLPEQALHGLAMDVSDPAHSSYGLHRSQSAMSSLLTPSNEALNHVMSWLASSGATNISVPLGGGSVGTWVDFQTTVGRANELLGANFEHFTCSAEARDEEEVVITRSLGYTIPAEVAEWVDLIHPVIHFPRIKPAEQRQRLQTRQEPVSFSIPKPREQGEKAAKIEPLSPRSVVSNACLTKMTPSCLVELYNINYAAPANETSPSKIGIAGFLEQYPNHEFVKNFLENHGLPVNRTLVDFTTVAINVANATAPLPTQGTIEATLDLDCTMAFTNPLSVTYYYTAGRGPYLNGSGVLQPEASGNEPYLEFLETYLSLEEPPQVLSISYSDDEQTIPYAYASRICTLFAALAARGVSVLVASGDGGVDAIGGTPCVSNDGKNTARFLPTFPASCPYVTSVGATNGSPEFAAHYSGGGFSNYFEVPEWQINATSSFISRLNGTYDGLYNKTGRGIPDISAFGDRYLITDAAGNQLGNPRGVSGTSASTPVVAAMVALLNDERLRNGKASLGWLNPLIYNQAYEEAWQDVIRESNPGCNTNGFNAGPGWDPITGQGSPLFDVLRRLVV